MSYELTGKVLQFEDVVQISDRFKKREFVLERERMGGSMVFTDYVKFQLVQDRVNLIDDVAVGDLLKVNFDIRGNKWEKNGETKYFTNLEAWKVEKVAADVPMADNTPPPPPPPGDDAPVSTETAAGGEPLEPMGLEEDDLPF